jgi:hypothetical protein
MQRLQNLAIIIAGSIFYEGVAKWHCCPTDNTMYTTEIAGCCCPKGLGKTVV